MHVNNVHECIRIVMVNFSNYIVGTYLGGSRNPHLKLYLSQWVAITTYSYSLAAQISRKNGNRVGQAVYVWGTEAPATSYYVLARKLIVTMV